MIKILLIIVIGYFAYQYLFGIESGCEKYASKYSCDYVINKANYDVYYWRNLNENDPKDNFYIASTTGLSACRDVAISYARSIKENWNSRAYVCVLKKDGKSMEKHRLL
jgi:hypothetical protein